MKKERGKMYCFRTFKPAGHSASRLYTSGEPGYELRRRTSATKEKRQAVRTCLMKAFKIHTADPHVSLWRGQDRDKNLTSHISRSPPRISGRGKVRLLSSEGADE